MKHLRLLWLINFVSIISFSARANVRLPAIIANHMVLQQKSSVTLWGWCEPKESITITTSWDNIIYRATGSSFAKWNVDVATPSAGGPYSITISGYNNIILEDVLIGEVWICSGQSNMEMSYSWGIKQYAPDSASATNKDIRFFHIPKLSAANPQDDTQGKWVVCNPQDFKTFSLAGYFFGQKLNETLSVPIGLIEAAWGGTPAEVWTPKDSIENNAVLKNAADSLKVNDSWPVTPAVTFNAMINPVVNFTIAGAIWYQGEANTGNASTYKGLFSTMINAWRSAWKINFPFYYVQIAPFSGYSGMSGALLQEAQTKTLAVPKTGMVVISDLVTDVKDIHPKDKKDVGLRLANYALAEVYGKKDLNYKSPLYESMEIQKEKVIIKFNNAEEGLMSKNGALADFYIAADDKVFRPALAKINGSTVIVSNKEIKHPVAVRFGFTNDAMPNLFNKAGLPANTFRTDSWDNIHTITP